jgi:hypothetical protein
VWDSVERPEENHTPKRVLNYCPRRKSKVEKLITDGLSKADSSVNGRGS